MGISEDESMDTFESNTIRIVDVVHRLSDECREYLAKRYRDIAIAIPPQELDSVAGILSALANTIRLKMLWLLIQKELPVCLLASILQKDESLISHHLKKLRDLGIVTEYRDGKFRIYRVNREIIDDLKKLIDLSLRVIRYTKSFEVEHD